MDNILFVFAHPDDDLLFFSNLIHKLKNEGKNIFLFSATEGAFISNKNKYDKKYADKRRLELQTVCLKYYKATLIHTPTKLFLDGSIINELNLSEYIWGFLVPHYNIKEIVTFDGKGQTNHKNHISIYKAVVFEPNITKNPQIKINILRTPFLQYNWFGILFVFTFWLLKYQYTMKFLIKNDIKKILLRFNERNRDDYLVTFSKVYQTSLKTYRNNKKAFYTFYRSQKSWYRCLWFRSAQICWFTQYITIKCINNQKSFLSINYLTDTSPKNIANELFIQQT